MRRSGISRRTVLVGVAAAAVAAIPRPAHGSIYSLPRDLRRMVGFTIATVDSLSRTFESRDLRRERFFELQILGLFKETEPSIALPPLRLSDVIVFTKPRDSSWRTRFPGLHERLNYEYRLLIDGDFFKVMPVVD